MSDVHRWVATYTDGTELHEIDPGGDPSKDQSFANVDHARLVSVALNASDGSTAVRVCVPQGVGARGIFFRRRALGINVDTTGMGATCIGWQRTVNGTNVKTMLWLIDDGRMMLTDRDPQDGP